MACLTCKGYSSRKCPCCANSERWTACDESFVQVVATELDAAIKGGDVDGNDSEQWETFVLDYIDKNGNADDKAYLDAIIDAFHDILDGGCK